MLEICLIVEDIFCIVQESILFHRWKNRGTTTFCHEPCFESQVMIQGTANL